MKCVDARSRPHALAGGCDDGAGTPLPFRCALRPIAWHSFSGSRSRCSHHSARSQLAPGSLCAVCSCTSCAKVDKSWRRRRARYSGPSTLFGSECKTGRQCSLEVSDFRNCSERTLISPTVLSTSLDTLPSGWTRSSCAAFAEAAGR